MARKTAIEWTDSSCNGQMGCDGCELWKPGQGGTCYAGVDVTKKAGTNSGMPADFGRPEIYPYRIIEACKWPDLTGKKRPGKPWLDGMPRLIFLDDYGDTFTRSLDDADYVRRLCNHAADKGRPAPMRDPLNLSSMVKVKNAVETGGHWLDPFVPMMEASPCIWQVLTKRPSRMRRFFDRLGYVPRNFWPMTSITSPRQKGRVRALLEIGDRNTIRGLSYEPILEDASGMLAEFLPGISWLIAGGESGRDARPCRLEWIHNIKVRCAAAEVAFFCKQLGSHVEAAEHSRGRDPRHSNRLLLRDKKGGDPSEWPGGLERFPREMP